MKITVVGAGFVGATTAQRLAEKELGDGEGGKNEDEEYFDLLPNI